MKFSIKYFSSKCDQIRSFFQIWSHLLEKSLMENFIFCTVILLIGKRVISFLFTKKVISRILKITVQCLFYQYVAKFLKGFYIINNMFNSSLEITTFTQKQSGFEPGDSCMNQLLSVSTSNHMLGRAIWDKLPVYSFENFSKITRVIYQKSPETNVITG